MKVQKFEEWLDEKSADWRENAPDSVINLMRDSWKAAHENVAARLDHFADNLTTGKRINQVDRHVAEVLRSNAEAIREAVRGKG